MIESFVTIDGKTIELDIEKLAKLNIKFRHRRKHNFDKSISIPKSRYFFIFRTACKLLVAAGINEFPLDIFKLAEHCGVDIVRIQDNIQILEILKTIGYPKVDDAVYVNLGNGQGIIFYNDDISTKNRIRFSILHELGHHILHRYIEIEYEIQEKEANMFAARLLMPMGILHACNVCTAIEIEYLCGASKEASEIRFGEYLEKLELNKFGTLPEEAMMLYYCEEFINRYNNSIRPLLYSQLDSSEIKTIKKFKLKKYKKVLENKEKYE